MPEFSAEPADQPSLLDVAQIEVDVAQIEVEGDVAQGVVEGEVDVDVAQVLNQA